MTKEQMNIKMDLLSSQVNILMVLLKQFMDYSSISLDMRLKLLKTFNEANDEINYINGDTDE